MGLREGAAGSVGRDEAGDIGVVELEEEGVDDSIPVERNLKEGAEGNALKAEVLARGINDRSMMDNVFDEVLNEGDSNQLLPNLRSRCIIFRLDCALSAIVMDR